MLALSLSIFGFEVAAEVIVIGAIIGVSYALFGMGVTLTYQSSRVINFAQGAIGSVPHLLVAKLVIDTGWSYGLALPVALAVAAGSGALLEFGVIRRLEHAPRLVVLVATLGATQLLLIPISLMVSLDDTKLAQAPYPVPFDASFKIGDLTLGAGQIMILIVAPIIVTALTLFLRKTSVGMASRAMAENAEAAQLSGIPTHRISLLVWSVAGLLGGMAAILAGPNGPIISFVFGGGTSAFSSSGNLLLRGLGAAMVGGLSSLPQVFGAGVALGVIEAVIRHNYPTGGTVDLILTLIILGSLVLRRDLRQLARGSEESNWSLSGSVRALPERLRNHPRVKLAHRGLLLASLAAAIVVPLPAQPGQRVLYTAILLYAMVGLSLVVLTGWAGQVSLGHFTFVAIGALVGGRMGQTGHTEFGSLLIAVAAGALVAVVVGLPALRVRGLFLAVSTLGFAVMADSWLVRQSWLVKSDAVSSSMRLPRPKWAGLDFQNELTYYYVVLAVLIAVMGVVHQLRRTGVARTIIAVRDNEPMAAALGVPPAATKLLAFVLSGAMASLAGWFFGMLLVDFRSAGLTSPGMSTLMVTMVMVGGATSITGAVLGALYVRGLPYFFDSEWAVLLSSGIGLLAVLLFVPGGLAGLAFRIRDRVVSLLTGSSVNDDDDETEAHVAPIRLEPRPRSEAPDDELAVVPALEARDVVMRYGGLAALGGVSVQAAPGEIVGLIGPNGAGKTTLFDVLSGLVTPTKGQVLLHGTDVTSMPPEARARLGLSRSFQQAKLFEDMTILELFQVALERRERSELVPSMLGLPPSRLSEWRKDTRSRQLVDLLGLGRFADKKAGELSTGTRRIAELGCTIALGADVILLDEPTGGIAQREVEAFTPVLRQIREHLDATMIVVAHDIPMITGLVDRMYVLSGGQVLAEGPPSLLQDDPAVIAAYLGADEGEVATIATSAPISAGAQ